MHKWNDASYCAPEEFVDEKHPYAFDMYGAAITWLRTVLSDDGEVDGEEGSGDDDNTKDSSDISINRGLADERNLFEWRISVRDFGHNLVAWEEYAALHGALPYGWHSLFGRSRRGVHALRLLSNMMDYAPGRRVSASEALVGPYLNPGCDAGAPPELPPAMPFSIVSHVNRWKKEREVMDGECQLDDLFTQVIAVELDKPQSMLTLEPRSGKVGARVKVVDGTDASVTELQVGDCLLAMGSIDCEGMPYHHIMELLEQWELGRPVPMLLVRDL